jgi:hypothetical protein
MSSPSTTPNYRARSRRQNRSPPTMIARVAARSVGSQHQRSKPSSPRYMGAVQTNGRPLETVRVPKGTPQEK